MSCPQIRNVLVATALLAFSVSGCGDADELNGYTATNDRPAPPASEFPDSAGRTLDDIVQMADPGAPTDPNVVVETQVFYPDYPKDRYSFTLADREQHEITDADVALYVAQAPMVNGNAFDEPASGPYPARLVSLATPPEFRSDSTLENPYSATAFYVAEVPFTSDGEWRVVALIRHDGKTTASTLPTAMVGSYRRIPRPGSDAPLIHTPATRSGNPDGATTRQPPGNLNDMDLATALGNKPVALLFTSPRYCQSRVCAPVTDVAVQMDAKLGEEIEFIQMELYRENDPARGVRPQVRRYNLPSEPWLFLIDRTGTVRSAIEGPFGPGELQRAAEEVSRG